MTHVLTVRAGALLRARTISAREAGHAETIEGLTEIGRSSGIELAGYRLGAALFRELEAAEAPENAGQREVDQGTIGGGGPWLRAEPGFDESQADALAAVVAMVLAHG